MGAKKFKIFGPISSLRVAPLESRNSAQVWNFEKRLDDDVKIGITIIRAKFHGNRPSGFVWRVLGFENGAHHFQIRSLPYNCRRAHHG